MSSTGSRWLMCMSLLTTIGCGSTTSSTADCGAPFETSCDVPSDNGVHTCYDVVVADAAALQRAMSTCAGQATNGTVLSACCNHANAVARCVFTPTSGGTSTEWFLSGTLTTAQSACAGKGGAFTGF